MSKPRLSAKELHTLQAACDDAIARLDSLHWSGLAYGAPDPYYSNLKQRRHEIELAKAKIADIFEAQFQS